MRAIQTSCLSVGILLLSVLGGCGDTRPGSVTRLNPRGVPYLEGVPVPGGFELLKKDSVDYESGGQRNARHVYVGHADPAAVRAFYQEQMPLLGWSRVSGEFVEGIVTLRFEKKTEACTVQIKPSGLFNRTTVQATLVPFNRSTTPEAPKRQMP